MGDVDFRTAKSRLAAEVRMFIIDIGDMKLDEDTADFLADRAGMLIARIEDAASDRDLNRIEDDLGGLQVVVHHALKRNGAQPAPGGKGS